MPKQKYKQPSPAILESYAKLLRTAWLNHGDQAAHRRVHEFEHEHDDVLAPMFRVWNGKDPFK